VASAAAAVASAASAVASAAASVASSPFEQAVRAKAKARAMMVLFRDMVFPQGFNIEFD
jgi:hypothetical protein